MIRSEAAGGKYAVDMWMKLQPLIPTVEHAEEADLGSKMPRIASNLKQRLGTGVKEQVVDQAFVLNRERPVPAAGKDGMHVAGGQQFPFTRLEPAHARVALASRAMPVSARVVRDGSRCPQPVQRSRCPPSAAVRQRVMASNTFGVAS